MYFDHDSIIPPNPVFFGPIQWYAVFIMTGITLAVLAAMREGKKRGISSELLLDLVLVGIPLSILGTRLYFVIFNDLRWYLQNPSRILAFRDGGLAIHGGIITAGLYAWWALKRKKIPLLPILDLVAVGFFIGQIVGRFGNFMNQEAHGPIINAPTLDAQREFLTSLFIPEFIVNGMFIRGNYHHPTFLYEALWNLIGLFIVIFILRRLSKILIGEIAAFYVFWYSFGRIFIEALRTDSLMIGPLRIAQVISIIAMVAVSILVVYRRKNQKEMIPYLAFNLQEYQNAKQQQHKKKKKNKK